MIGSTSILFLALCPIAMAIPSLDVDTHHVLTALPAGITTVASDIQPAWASSYSVGGACYCLPNVPVDTTVLVNTPFGKQTVGAVCSLIGPGPGVVYDANNNGDRPLYNDPQCGNGLPLTTDEALCPGRVDHGVVGCRYIGPQWDFTEQLAYNSVPGGILEDNTAVLEVAGLEFVTREWGNSYSLGDHCYCMDNWRDWPGSTTTIVSTSIGNLTVAEACELVGEGPGATGRPTYNDIQCGNGPASTTDEEACPGRADFGVQGCRFVGPTWNFGTSAGAPISVEFIDNSPTAPLVSPAVDVEPMEPAATTTTTNSAGSSAENESPSTSSTIRSTLAVATGLCALGVASMI